MSKSCPFELPVKKRKQPEKGGFYKIKDAQQKLVACGMNKDEADYIVQAINSHEKFKTYKTERENVFVLLNEKQLPIVGGMCLDSIIRNLVKQFERRQSFIEEHDECEAYREYEVFCNEQELKQALKEAKKP